MPATLGPGPPFGRSEGDVVDDTLNPEDWPLTSRVIAESERANRGDYDLDDGDEPEFGNALLHLYADLSPDVTQIGPGVFYARKVEP